MSNAETILIFICGMFVGFAIAAGTIYLRLTRRIAFVEKAGIMSYRDRAYRLTRIDDGARQQAPATHATLEEIRGRLREHATAGHEGGAPAA